jgi:type II secretory pathway component GspD/PulD (secretin)
MGGDHCGTSQDNSFHSTAFYCLDDSFNASGYQVVPLQAAAQRGALDDGGVLQAGYQIRVVPLRYITVPDAQRALEPLISPGTIVQGDPRGGLVTLAGTATEVERAERAILLFDVDWLRKQSL